MTMYAFALLLTAGPSAPVSPTEAELLLRQMDARITAANSLRIEFEVRNDTPGKEQQLLTASLVLGDRNRLRYEQSGSITATAVSDGRRTVTVVVNPDEKRSQETPEWFNEVLKGWLGRGGTYISTARAFEYLDGSDRPGPADGPQVSNVKLAPDEEVGKVKARVVEYDLTWVKHPAVDGADTARVRVWIDPKTELPIRRQMTFRVGDKDETYTATHTKFDLNPKLNDKLFELPR
jgi:outer membrane lipoprotein-sorting protein